MGSVTALPVRTEAPERPGGGEWPEESLENYAKTGRYATLLYPFTGETHEVRTPKGKGTLLQVFSDRCEVLLYKTRPEKAFGKKPVEFRPTTRFRPEEIEPVA